jgi:hypothetical protein
MSISGVCRGWEPSFDVDTNLGKSVLITDMNNDSYEDILMGAPNFFPSVLGWKGQGIVYLLLGRPKDQFASYYDIHYDCDGSMMGQAVTYAGTTLNSGDLDGDGYNDLLIGCPGGGQVRIIYGAPTVNMGSYFTFYSPDDSTGLGNSLCAGDINNDGYDDILAGAFTHRGWGGTPDNTGRAYIICGRPRSQMTSGVTVETLANMTIYGSTLNDYLGADGAIGDLNGDGFEDIFVTAPSGDGWNDQVTDCGDSYVIWGNDYISYGLGKNGDPQNSAKKFNITQLWDMVIYGGSEDDNCGYSSYMADVDQDGFEDLQFCAPAGDGPGESWWNCGETYLLFGGDEGFPKVLNISNKEVDLIIYGANPSDRVGSAITSGDMDSDGFIDIVVSSNYADGVGNMRKNCGETYIIFASGIRTKGFGLLDGYNPETRQEDEGYICHSGRKYYTFYSVFQDSEGVGDIDQVNLTLDPEGLELEYIWDQETDTFSEFRDPGGYAMIDTASSYVDVSGINITLYFSLMFDWDYPTEDFQGAKVVIYNDSGIRVQARYYGIYKVENDLNLTGDLQVTSSVFGDISLNGSWCPQEGHINWTGVRAVYDGTVDIYPPEDTFNLRLNNSVDEWYDNDSMGQDVFITTPFPPASDNPWGERYDLNIVDRVVDSRDDSDLWHYLRTDTLGPPAPTGLKVYPDGFDGPPGTLDNDKEVYVKWDEVFDTTDDAGNLDGMGIKNYYISTSDGSGTTDGDTCWESGGLQGYYYDSANFYNLSFSKVEIDLDQDWGYWSPNDLLLDGDNFSVRWVGKILLEETTTYTFFIHADDGAKVWIDEELIYDEWRPPHPYQVIRFYDSGLHDIRIDYRDELGKASFQMQWAYGTHLQDTVPSDHLYYATTWAKVEELEEGNNTIFVWAEDLFGNIGPAASINVTSDTQGPYFIEPVMKENGWYTDTVVQVGITVADNISGASDDIKYSTSHMGLSGYSKWLYVAVGIMQPHPDNNKWINFRFDQDFVEGTDNYVRFQAKDQLENGYSISKDYNIRIDTTEVLFTINAPDNSTILNEKLVEFNVSLSDPGGSGLDKDLIEYRYSFNTTAHYTNWTTLPTKFIDLYGNGKYSRINLSMEFPEGRHNWVQFRAKDVAGNGWTYSEHVRFQVDIPIVNEPPELVISHPLNNATFYYGDPILFDASNSTDDGVTGIMMFSWRSSWDGYIGFGDRFVRGKPLLIGNHTVTVYMDDGQYNVSESIYIRIIEKGSTEYINPENLDNLTDTDGDGMLDSWEMEHFGDLTTSDGTGDSDGDGYSDKLEYLYDTDPNDKEDRPPASVPPDKEDDKEKTSNYAWLFLILLVLLFVIGAVIFYFYMQKKEKESELMGDNAMIMRAKTSDDLEEDGRPIEKDEYHPAIQRKSKKQMAKERRKLYNKKKRGKKGKARKKKLGASEMHRSLKHKSFKKKKLGPRVVAGSLDEDDEFGEHEMDLGTVDPEMEDDLSDLDDLDDDLKDFFDDEEDDFQEPEDEFEEPEDEFEEFDDDFDDDWDDSDDDWEDDEFEEP